MNHNAFSRLQFKEGHANTCNMLGDFCDSPDHPLFIASSQNLYNNYYDDFEVCDALGSYKKRHKLGKCKL